MTCHQILKLYSHFENEDEIHGVFKMKYLLKTCIRMRVWLWYDEKYICDQKNRTERNSSSMLSSQKYARKVLMNNFENKRMNLKITRTLRMIFYVTIVLE